MINNKLLLEVFLAFFIFLFIVAIGTVTFLAQQRQTIVNYARETEEFAKKFPIAPDEVIVKFKEKPDVNLEEINLQQTIQKEDSRSARALEIIGIQAKDQTVPRSIIKINREHKIEKLQEVFEAKTKAYTVKFDKDVPVPQVIRELEKNPDVEYAEPNYLLSIQSIPNDPDFYRQWGLNNTGQDGGTSDADIDAPEAWDKTASDTRTIIVAVIDSGVDFTHPELAANIWVNPNEVSNNNRDDDNNGLVDDVRGWNFYNNTNVPDDENGHGTHVAGIIGAVANNKLGVVGVARKVKIMPINFMSPDGQGYLEAASQAVYYAVDKGALVINASFGGYAFETPKTLYEAITYARNHGVIFVTSSGNDGVEIGQYPYFMYPAIFNLDNMITVAASDQSDQVATFSNYSRTYVDIVAPGVNITSTLPNNMFGYKSGTSMAAPLASGAVALALAHYPQSNYSQIINYVTSTVDKSAPFSSKTVKGGRLNINKAVTANNPNPTSTPTLTPTHTPTPSPTRIPTPTNSVPPTITPTRTLSPTRNPSITVQPCQNRSIGDADCANGVNELDFVCWKNEYVNNTILNNCFTSDFDANGSVSILDYAIWRWTFILNNG